MPKASSAGFSSEKELFPKDQKTVGSVTKPLLGKVLAFLIGRNEDRTRESVGKRTYLYD